MPNVQKIDYHSRRKDAFEKALKRSQSFTDHKFTVDLPDEGHKLMSQDELHSAIDQELAAIHTAATEF